MLRVGGARRIAANGFDGSPGIPATQMPEKAALERGVRKNESPPHVRDGAIVVPEPFLRLFEVTTDDVDERIDRDLHCRTQRLANLVPERRASLVRWYRALGILLCLAGTLFAVDSLVFSNYHHYYRISAFG